MELDRHKIFLREAETLLKEVNARLIKTQSDLEAK
jgi:hypothetical protein